MNGYNVISCPIQKYVYGLLVMSNVLDIQLTAQELTFCTSNIQEKSIITLGNMHI